MSAKLPSPRSEIRSWPGPEIQPAAGALTAQQSALFRAIVEGSDCPAVTNAEGLAAYQSAYRIRLEEALREDFPVSLPLLPESLRFAMLEEFFRSAPSTLFTLDAFGALWAAFLRGWAAELEASAPGLADLADLEWRLVLTRFRDSAAEPARHSVALPAEPPVFLHFARALELFESAWPLAEIYEQEALQPAAPSRLAVWRAADGSACFRELEELPFLLLGRLAGGLSWEQVVAGFPETPEFAGELQAALADLAEDGLVALSVRA